MIFFYFENGLYQIFASIIYISIAILTSNVLVVPTYEFLSFPFLKYENPLCHFYTFSKILTDEKQEQKEEKDIQDENNILLNYIFFFISVLYTFGFFLALIINVNFFKLLSDFILLLIVYAYYLVIFMSYTIISILIIYNFYREKDYFKERHLPKMNLLSYSIIPLYQKNYKGNEIKGDDTFWDKKNKTRVGIFVILLFVVVISCFKQKNIKLGYFFVQIFLITSIISISIVLNFPICYKNIRTVGNIFNTKIELKDEYKPDHPLMLSVIRFVCDIFFILISLTLCLSFFLMKEEFNEDLLDLDNFVEIFKNKIDSKYRLLPNICTSSVYNMPIYKYIPFINDAYYYDNIKGKQKTSSFEYENYKKIFFDDLENYNITPKGNLLNDSFKVKMVRYDVINKNEDINITILSIKGTSHKEDIYMDIELFMPSVFLNLLSSFSIFGNEMNTYINRIIEYSLSLPYRLVGQYFFIDNYIKGLMDAYYANNSTFLENVVIVGHSLGGGLSKILARITKEQAISLSGPGINAFHSLWTEHGNSENYGISIIDLVPDMDLVLRVEVSGGTVYRIICNQGPFKCHNKAISLCETLIMCRNPYSDFYCLKMGNIRESDIRKIKEKSELDQKINEIK